MPRYNVYARVELPFSVEASDDDSAIDRAYAQLVQEHPQLGSKDIEFEVEEQFDDHS